MKIRFLGVFFLMLCFHQSFSQREWANPIIKDYGRILDLEEVDVRPDASMEYKIVIELIHKMDNPERINFSATNVARLINLHAVGGVSKDKLKVAVVIHAEATNSVINNEAYRDKYDGKDNPYFPLYEQLAANGVEVIVCGQSLNLYGHDKSKVIPQVKVATSALTAVSTFQLRGYAYFKWD
ncbi:DsrE family protein [Roseivirga sp. UBA1976]|uniref:DsrE family protein n=1 Tax=Roseivirga sp. UBA1976 TaxID=1947386 RepID=UPI00257F60AE|nr:DsrE family protein [Roseivirga sp. UBA1976]|tara:strand:- start:944 stop:1489 length:546 start_codon:yes stop_codon:yes gene_type:complete